MNNENRNDEAVSPVIATILMVAITVVLAGVLYVWASSLAEGNTDG
ncbi:MAG: archaellin/type IV pilin N-terminal domain-containing protein, partial [Candidatus Poseidoniaceae archaeon]